MKYLIILTLLLLNPVAYADFDDGLKAYLEGDYKTALEEFEPLAKQGNSNAQLRLANLHAMGHGVLRDYTEALYWLKKSAAQLNGTAEYNIGMYYIYGYGVDSNLKKAKYWIKRAYTNPYSPSNIKKSAKETWEIYELGTR